MFTSHLIMCQQKDSSQEVVILNSKSGWLATGSNLYCAIWWRLTFNPFLDDKIIALSKLKAFADDNPVTQNITLVFHRGENIVGKGEKAVFRSSFFAGVRGVKSRNCA